MRTRKARPERFRISLRDEAEGTPLPLPSRRMWPIGIFFGVLFLIFAAIAWSQIASIGGHRVRSVFDLVFVLFQGFWVLGWSVGVFMAGHFLFIYYFFVRGIEAAGPEPGVWAALLDLFIPLWPALAALFISHGVSFFTNYLGQREYLGMDLKTQMSEPYKRIIVMHITIIIGGFLTMLLRTPEAALLLLIALKTAADLSAHRKEHARQARTDA